MKKILLLHLYFLLQNQVKLVQHISIPFQVKNKDWKFKHLKIVP